MTKRTPKFKVGDKVLVSDYGKIELTIVEPIADMSGYAPLVRVKTQSGNTILTYEASCSLSVFSDGVDNWI